YPKLSKIVFNYLSPPLLQSAVEGVFLQGQQLLYFTCNQLSGSSIQASLCFGDWSRKDLIDSHNVVETI
ncbi:hypothetical protein L208DRAFT_1211510, partial [Tricholoma matsutake]